MRLANHIGPDIYLQLEAAIEVSMDDVKVAWERAYGELHQGLQGLSPDGTLYIVFGLQGAGKTTWINRNAPLLGSDCIFFDGPLPSREKRSRALAMASAANIKSVAVWLDTPIELALERNAMRRGLANIKEEAIRHVQGQLQLPSIDEGFSRIIRVSTDEG
jgi:thymidylate kinase